MTVTIQDFAIKAALLIAAIAVSNLQWSLTLSPNAPALFHFGSLLPAVIFVPIISVIPGALFLGLIAITVNHRTRDQTRACFLMGLYVATLWIVYSKVSQSIYASRASSSGDINSSAYWYLAYVWAFFYGLPGVSLEPTPEKIVEERNRRQQESQKPGINRWLLIGACSLFVFIVTVVIIALTHPPDAWRFGGIVGGLSAVLFFVVFLVLDLFSGRLRFWKISLPQKNHIHLKDWSARKQQLIDEKNWRGLANLALQWTQAEQDNFSAWFSLGLAFLHLDDFSNAGNAFRRALTIDRSDAATWYNLGLANEQLNFSDHAIRAYRNAVRCNPDLKKAVDRLRKLEVKDRHARYEQAHANEGRASERTDRPYGRTESGFKSDQKDEHINFVEFLNNLLRAMLAHQGSRLNIAAGTQISILADGTWMPVSNVMLEPAHTREMAYALMTTNEAAEFSEKKECRFSIKPLGIGEFNVRVFYDERAIAIEIRLPDENGHSSDQEPDKSIWFEILGVRENATYKEVRTAYRKLMQEYHPDRVANLGQELRDLAELKTKKITQAFRDFERNNSN